MVGRRTQGNLTNDRSRSTGKDYEDFVGLGKSVRKRLRSLHDTKHVSISSTGRRRNQVYTRRSFGLETGLQCVSGWTFLRGVRRRICEKKDGYSNFFFKSPTVPSVSYSRRSRGEERERRLVFSGGVSWRRDT